jgi:hypothetical protein
MPLPLSVCFSDTLMRRPLAGDLGLLGGHRRGQLRDSRADVLREVLKVAALSGPATRERAANRLGTERSASSCSRNHSLSGTT